MTNGNLMQLAAFDKETGAINAITETPRGSRNKMKYDDKAGLFKFSGVLPEGMSFPYDFGFVSYNRIRGEEFKSTGRFGPDKARQLVDEGVARAKKGE